MPEKFCGLINNATEPRCDRHAARRTNLGAPQVKYLNNIVEEDHRAIKRVTPCARPSNWFSIAARYISSFRCLPVTGVSDRRISFSSSYRCAFFSLPVPCPPGKLPERYQ